MELACEMGEIVVEGGTDNKLDLIPHNIFKKGGFQIIANKPEFFLWENRNLEMAIFKTQHNAPGRQRRSGNVAATSSNAAAPAAERRSAATTCSRLRL